jgi:hypothetical protein
VTPSYVVLVSNVPQDVHVQQVCEYCRDWRRRRQGELCGRANSMRTGEARLPTRNLLERFLHELDTCKPVESLEQDTSVPTEVPLENSGVGAHASSQMLRKPHPSDLGEDGRCSPEASTELPGAEGCTWSGFEGFSVRQVTAFDEWGISDRIPTLCTEAPGGAASGLLQAPGVCTDSYRGLSSHAASRSDASGELHLARAQCMSRKRCEDGLALCNAAEPYSRLSTKLQRPCRAQQPRPPVQCAVYGTTRPGDLEYPDVHNFAQLPAHTALSAAHAEAAGLFANGAYAP